MIIKYRPALPSDAKNIIEMRNHSSTNKFLTDDTQYSVEQCADWISGLSQSSRRIVVETDTGDFIGLIRVDNIDNHNKNCMVGLDISVKFRGQRLSYDIFEWLFDTMYDMHMVYLLVMETNHIARKVYTNLGFSMNGILPDRIYRNDKYYSYIYMSLILN